MSSINPAATLGPVAEGFAPISFNPVLKLVDAIGGNYLKIKVVKKVKLLFEINEDSFNLLKKINENGYAEYRDHEWNTLEDFKKSDHFLNGVRTEEWFLKRNFGGTAYLLDDLIGYGLIESDGESWHLTYIVSKLGEKILEKY